MPANLPSSFASAAAGQNSGRDARGGRSDGRASGGDWSRRDGRSANGTLTFRRSSTTPLGQPSQQPPMGDGNMPLEAIDNSEELLSAADTSPARYSKDELLTVYRRPRDEPSRLFCQGWSPGNMNGTHGRAWGKSNENHIPQEPGACWVPSGNIAPLGMEDMSSEERELFSSDINSPVKHPPTQGKEGHQGGVNGRKPSVSQGVGGTYGLNSPSSATRPGTRRRETLDSNPFSATGLNSPTTTNRFNRDESAFWHPRKGADNKDTEEEVEAPETPRDAPSRNPFGSLLRSHTTGSPAVGSSWLAANQPTTPGAGGFGQFAIGGSAVGDKRVGGGIGGGSRLTHLMPKESATEPRGDDGQNPLNQQSWRSRPRTDTDPFGEDGVSGSAILGGARDTNHHPASRAGTLGTPSRVSAGDFGMSALNLGSQADDDGPASPSVTNPFRSPAGAERHEQADSMSNERHVSAIGQDQLHGPSILARGLGGVGLDGSDRSQTSSAGAKGFPMVGIPGWPGAGGPSTGTPDRERPNYGAAFGGSLFNPVGGDVQSPGVGNLTSVFGPAGAGGLGTGSIGRGSKLSSLLPPAMQAQMQSNEQLNDLSDSVPDIRHGNPLGAIGRHTFPLPTRDTESPLRPNRGIFEEMFPSNEQSRAQRAFNPAEPSNAPIGSEAFTPVNSSMPFGGNQSPADSAQVRQMVMPDRMRWVYLDPQGHIQGPFTGLEMNDWYKANFFTPDLRVKKVEDHEFEPLGQLIRRIGNSREPFLVPQIGVAHGPASQAGPFTPAPSSGVVPPLSGVFPSFGRTLTAEEQNNLERRKQEEQFLMAQQREFMMRQQVMSKYGVSPGLQHHSSAQSLQSQPSFGSMTSPAGVPQQHTQQPIGAMPPSAGFFDNPPGSQATGRTGSGDGDYFIETDFSDITAAERQVLASMQGRTAAGDFSLGQMKVSGEQGLSVNLPSVSQLENDPEGFRDRLLEFDDLRAQHEAEQRAKADKPREVTNTKLANVSNNESAGMPIEQPTISTKAEKARKKAHDEALLSLTQQVQQAQAAAAAAAPSAGPDMPMPFPPPASTTPLPAPMAQRARSNLPEQYSRSQTGTPDEGSSAPTQAPSLAPWAKETSQESSKGPSLKEIQEAEARKAARAGEAASAMRKAAMEQETALLKEKEKLAAAVAQAASLPASSTWGHGSPSSASSPWTKPAPTKMPAPGLVPTTASANKKTLADIQREEELRKQKVRVVSAQQGAPVGSSAKSYANLAGKPGQPGIPNASSPAAISGTGIGWATVGAGGKVRIPTGPAATLGRSVSASTAKPAVLATMKPMSRPGPAAIGKVEPGNVAIGEFSKWVGRELSRGITGVNDIGSFQASLDVLPLDTGIIADAVYANSTTMDGRHFAEEYVRRKKLAERGIVEKQPIETSKSVGGSGWNEVAKKSGNPISVKESDTGIQGPGFKVVPSRKKGKK